MKVDEIKEVREFIKKFKEQNKKLAQENFELKQRLKYVEYLAKGLIHRDFIVKIDEVKKDFILK